MFFYIGEDALSKRKNNQGFTLIELIIVIIIIGILSATALPKFINLKNDALLASMDSLVGVIESADSLIYMKAAISNTHNLSSSTITIDSTEVDLVYGYPAGTADGIVKVIENNADDWNNGDKDGDWHSRKSSISGAWIYWHGYLDEDAWTERCFIRYYQSAGEGEAPVIYTDSSGCE